jgi:hypothetical protein
MPITVEMGATKTPGAITYSKEKNLTLSRAISTAHRSGLKMASNRRVDSDLKSGKNTGVFRTGTFVIYESLDRPFGEKIEYEGITYEVPQKYQGQRNKMLVFEHEDGVQMDAKGTLVGDKVKDVDCPSENGWYKLDPETGMPNGKEPSSEDDRDARYWYGRRSKYGGIFAAVRGSGDSTYLVYGWRTIDVVHRPDYGFGVAWSGDPIPRKIELSDLLRLADDAERILATGKPDTGEVRDLISAVREFGTST